MADKVYPDSASWSEVKITMMFTMATAAVFLIVFETSRRNPVVSAVFDRRRSTKPHRTPPPLILSRYFEWLFLSTDPAYSEYAEMTHAREVIKERRRQQKESRFRLPYNLPGIGEKKGGIVVETIVEEEEPKKKKKKHHLQTQPVLPNLSTAKAPKGASTREGTKNGPPRKGSKYNQSEKKLTYFPPSGASLVSTTAVPENGSGRDNQSKRARFHPAVVVNKTYHIEAANESSSSSSNDESTSASSTEIRMLASPLSSDGIYDGPGAANRRFSHNVGREIKLSNSNYSFENSIHSQNGEEVEVAVSKHNKKNGHHISDSRQIILSSAPNTYNNKKPNRTAVTKAFPHLTPDVVEVNGRRLPASIAQHAIAGDLTEEQLGDYERRLLERELNDEKKFKERQKEMRMKRAKEGKQHRKRGMDLEAQDDDDSDDSDDESLELLAPPSRLSYFGFQNNEGRGFLGRFLSWRGSLIPSGNGILMNGAINAVESGRSLVSSGRDSGAHVNRHLKSTVVSGKRPLSTSDQELLRCIGLDAFVMIRFLRFGFDVTFYPFVVACLTLIPVYYTSSFQGDTSEDGTAIETGGYFQITINRIQPGSHRLWVAWSFAILFYCFILRRIWIEWETFIALRFDFLANGDVEKDFDALSVRKGLLAQKDDVQLHLEQFRNSCVIEYIPESHRRDQELFQFFDAVFPNQVKRAEILLNASHLTKLIKDRQSYIVRYENLYAEQFHEKQQYRKRMENQGGEDVGMCQYLCCRCLGRAPKKPQEPKVMIEGSAKCYCCGKKMVKALPYYLSEIKRLNRDIEKEHRRILDDKQKVEDKDTSHDIFITNLAKGMKFVTGIGGDLTCGTGFVEFQNLTAKQSALQCNISGTNEYFVTRSAPDPRDIIWENATVERRIINIKRTQCDGLLFTGTLFWSVVVTAVTSISNLEYLKAILPSWIIPKPTTFWYGLIQGYLPVVFLELIMLFVPIVLKLIGVKYIRFKTQSEMDQFVFKWHFGYRTANLIIIIVNNQIYETYTYFKTNPQAALDTLAAGISASSQFFLNSMIVAAGSENMFELAQMPKMVFHFLMHQYITVEAKSKRALEKLEEPEAFKWGEVVPPFIFAFLVATVYSTIVPLVLGACAVFFYIATKVYTHQALFVYAQLYEGGGKLMYQLNRTLFVIMHIAITIFAILLGLRQAKFAGPSFFFTMNIITYLVNKKIYKTFVTPSVTLALTNARLIDEENKEKDERALRYKEYKAAKLEKRRQAAKAAKIAERDNKMQQNKGTNYEAHIGLPVVPQTAALRPSRASNLSSSTVGTNKLETDRKASSGKRIQFEVRKEDNEDQLRQRRASRMSKKDPRGLHDKNYDRYGENSDSSEDGGGKHDFYLYRQPQLNKSLWETKPRPYR